MKKTIISFTHSNYCIRSAGTEKFVRNLSEIIQQQGYHHLNFFSFYDDYNRMKQKMVGVNLDDHFKGVFKYTDLQKIIDYYSYLEELAYCSMHMQHLLHHDLSIISSVILKLKIPVYIILHDYYLVCPNIKLINSNGCFCGINSPSNEKCGCCKYKEEAIEHSRSVNIFLHQIDKYMKKIVTPSDFVTNNMKKVFFKYADRFVTRPHVKTFGDNELGEVDGKISIAFAGAQTREKGYEQWIKFVDEINKFCPNTYDFFYLGNGENKCPHVNNVFVSVAHQGDCAMIDNAKKENISCAFVWPELPETYSYVYYELSVSGVYILSNQNSGNICCAIKENQNGYVFNDYNKIVKMFSNPDDVRKTINLYRTHGKFRPEGFKNNDDLSSLISDGVCYTISYDVNKINPAFVHTLLYKVKHRDLLKRSKHGSN